MANPIYSYELNDPDFVWLFEQYLENNCEYCLVEEMGLPVVLIPKKDFTQIHVIEEPQKTGAAIDNNNIQNKASDGVMAHDQVQEE